MTQPVNLKIDTHRERALILSWYARGGGRIRRWRGCECGGQSLCHCSTRVTSTGQRLTWGLQTESRLWRCHGSHIHHWLSYSSIPKDQDSLWFISIVSGKVKLTHGQCMPREETLTSSGWQVENRGHFWGTSNWPLNIIYHCHLKVIRDAGVEMVSSMVDQLPSPPLPWREVHKKFF